MNTIKAEPGYPVPVIKQGSTPKYPWRTMEVNESFQLDNATAYAQALMNSRKLAPKTFKAGRYDGSWRVWRVK